LLVATLPAAAQVAPNRTTAYLHPSDVGDARAIWVNPAGLAARYEASVHVDVLVPEPGEQGRLGQLTIGFNSRGFALAYQRDDFDTDVIGHTYRVALASTARQYTIGLAGSFYRGGASEYAIDLGARFAPQPDVAMAVVVQNIGEPTVRGVRQSAAVIPSITLHLLGPAIGLSAQGAFRHENAASYAFGLRLSATRRLPLGLLVRLDTDDSLRRAAFAFGVSWGGENVVGVVATTPGDVSRVDAASAYGVASRQIGR
jgi:hypothetical protein